MKALYGLLVTFLRIVVAVFFRTSEVVGVEQIPKGPVIFCGNHPNSLMDPVLITTTCGRKVHFLAKDTLFRWRMLRFVMKTMGAVPVKRRVDHADGQLDNKGPFEALFEVLGKGGACGIFPEGISHAKSQLAPLKTGAARIALESAAQQRGKAPVHVVPCGLNYYGRTRMRSRVLVQFGPPLEIDATWIEAWEKDERKTVRELTDAIDVAIRALTINAPDFETLRVLHGVRRLYTHKTNLPLEQHAELTRRFYSHYEEHKEKPEIRDLYRDVDRYVEDVRDLGLSERQLSEGVSPLGVAGRVLGHLLLLLVFAPLTIPGLLIHAPVLLSAVLAGDGLTARKDVIATTKVMVTCLLVPVAYAVIVAALWLFLPEPDNLYAALGACVFLPSSGLATIRVMRRQEVVRRSLWVLLNLVTLRAEIERLRTVRTDLETRVWTTVDRYIDPDLERILPASDAPPELRRPQ